jgi:hypothetical protein
MIVQQSDNASHRVRAWLIIAGVLAAFLFAVPQGQAQTGGAFRSATAGKLKSDQPRNVRDHRGPGGARSGGVKVSVTCNKKKHPHCHSH